MTHVAYHQITSDERKIIALGLQKRWSFRQIADFLGRAVSTISREIRRNSGPKDGVYRVDRAIRWTKIRRSHSRRNEQFSELQKQIVFWLLRLKWSPEQISGVLKEAGLLSVSHETIYLWVWKDKAAGGSLYKHLRQAVKLRRKRYRSYDSRGRLAGKRHISERPVSADRRSRKGHWEMDTVMGKGGYHCIVTLVDRKTGYVLIGKLRNRTTAELNRRVIKLFRESGLPLRSITTDNGTEFHGYKKIEAALGVKVYFATPYHSWERGTSENTNGLIRQYLPKGKSMTRVSQARCDWIALQLNERPRKRLGYRCPEEVM